MSNDTPALLGMSARLDAALLRALPTAELRRALRRGKDSKVLEAHRARIKEVLRERGERV